MFSLTHDNTQKKITKCYKQKILTFDNFFHSTIVHIIDINVFADINNRLNTNSKKNKISNQCNELIYCIKYCAVRGQNRTCRSLYIKGYSNIET